MRIRMIAALTGTAGLLLTGTAHAYPVKDKTLTQNALYSTGALTETECAEKSVKDGDPASARKYLTAVLNCLNVSWKTHLEAAGLRFTKPIVKIYTKAPARFCGHKFGDSEAWHCAQSRTIAIRLHKDLLDETGDLYLFHLMSQMYAYHVQNLVGIDDAYQNIPYKNTSELNEQIRRDSLQSDCLAGVFIKSVWPSLERPVSNWNHLMGLVKDEGDTKGEPRVYGKGANRVYWSKRGYTTGDPASCNTWSASPATVS
ncbi:neutral zinc metallopeptidase [Planomonospora sp. ID82291]|uniref:neutral zinc metallopeptidase n=1 Tax=Planomonospora sp. ID82291 TaxID=2738136 RepID=UPI0018C42951|nr:neutral zinc metallopeptidase [Planomonospora sp. ID82291]MBG0812815.1 neutral zinc metallopeptidase [Planomonospora sp. ID82291]